MAESTKQTGAVKSISSFRRGSVRIAIGSRIAAQRDHVRVPGEQRFGMPDDEQVNVQVRHLRRRPYPLDYLPSQ